MSRCFTFPPPGYEKKARLDDDDSLNKDKQREKKPKKEKKDKEKREDKEKKEKDRSDGKHRDKKEKDKEKKKEKEKERDKDKDKKASSEDKRLAVQSDSNSREKLTQKQNERDKDKDKNSISDEKKQVLQFQGNNGDKPIRNSLFAEGTGDFKFVQELCRRIRDEEEGAGSQLVDRFSFTDRKNAARERVVVKDTRNLAGGKEKNNEKGVVNRTIAGVDARSSGGAVVQNLVGLVQNRVEGLPRLLEKQIERRVEEKEKSKEREGGDKRGDKRKEKDKEKKSHGKDKESEKEKKREEKVREKSEHKTKDGAKLQDSKKNEQLGAMNVRNPHGTKDGDRNSATEGILKKRKDLEANGFLHATDARPNKMPRPSPHPSTENGRKLEPCHTAIQFTSDGAEVRPIKLPRPSHPSVENGRKLEPCQTPILLTSDRQGSPITGAEVRPIKLPRPSPHPSVENGRKLEPCQTPILLTSDRQGPLSNLKLNNKELKVNGVIESQPLPISSKKSPSPSTKAEKIAEASTKPPHPDSKYLSRVLSVPKMEEWSDFDDQEWLFSGKDCSAEKKPKVGSAESPMVWAEALQIESADICALPYVIPY